MVYNLLLIPIITGYFILTNSSFFKYNSQRTTRSRILFESLTIGLFTIGVGFLIRTCIDLYCPKINNFLFEYLSKVPIEKPMYFWTFLLSCFICISVFIILELIIFRFYSNRDAIAWAVNKNGNELERLVKDSVLSGTTIQVTLSSGKVYIGFCEETPIPQKTNYLTISPILSGYRDAQKKLIITTDYFKVVEDFIKKIEKDEGVLLDEITLNTDIVIKQDEIISAGIYEQDIFDMFNKPKPKVKPKPKPKPKVS